MALRHEILTFLTGVMEAFNIKHFISFDDVNRRGILTAAKKSTQRSFMFIYTQILKELKIEKEKEIEIEIEELKIK